MHSSLPLSFNPPLIHRPQPPPLLHPNSFSPFPISKPSFHPLSKPLISFSLSASNNSNYDREEARWLREEQRWLREEQRWLRQESRWQAERESHLREISALRLRIQELERQSENHGVSVANVAALLQMLKKEAELLESGSSTVPMVLEAAESGGKVEEEVVVVKEVVREEKKEGKELKKRATLRKGSEGEDVRVMQVCLLAI
ncbi:hypothetical protein CsSME_00020420 [Camellia sinensis var. sinensis]